ncbi:MAG: MFS transporter [Planctomycetes bacterium]|nr:MFS transporter [Planctomycetota bacterium]
MNGERAAPRIVAFYLSTFAVMGIYMPFWPLWLADRGLGEAEIGTIVSVGILVRVLNPVLAQAIDRIGRTRATAIVLCTASTLSFALFEFASGFSGLLATSVLLGLSFMMIYPMTDTLAARTAGEGYGRLRLWGSLSFLGVNVASGLALDRFGVPWLYPAILTALFLSVACACFLPDPPRSTTPSHVVRPLATVLANRRFVCFVAGAGLIQASHAGIYSFGTLHWKSLGIDEFTIGWLWACGVLAEVILLHNSARIAQRLQPRHLVLIGGACAIVRWSLTAITTSEVALFFVQVLHALSFAATHLAVITHIRRHVPAEASVTAISVYAAIGTGLGMAGATFGAGFWFAAFGAGMFWIMAAIAGIGTLTARLSRMV